VAGNSVIAEPKGDAVAVEIPSMPAPLRSDVARLEASIGGTLPSDYADFVRVHDGATPQRNSISISSENESGVRRFVPVAEAAPLIGKIDGFPTGAIPFAEDDCGNYFYIRQKSGGVYFWDHEVDGGDMRLASTLAEFISALQPGGASSFKLAPGQVIRAWVNPTFKPEFD
jgi:hypothetical protein